MLYHNLQVKNENNITIIKINRPERLNALNNETRNELINAIDEFELDSNTKVAVITGSKGSFSVGADLFDTTGEISQEVIKKDLEYSFHIIVKKIRYSKKIFISALDGIVAGAGISIAFSCDYVFATKRTRFILAFQNVGLAPDTGITYILTRLAGSKFMKFLIEGGEFSAEYAEQNGLLEIVDDPLSHASKIAYKISDGPFQAYSVAKKFINKSIYNDFDNFLNFEANEQSTLANTYDLKEGIRAFREKKEPKFKGE